MRASAFLAAGALAFASLLGLGRAEAQAAEQVPDGGVVEQAAPVPEEASPHADEVTPPAQEAPAPVEETPPDVELGGHVVSTEVTEELEPTLVWDPGWGRVGIPEYLLIGVTAVISLVNVGIGPRQDSPSQGGWLFDEDARRVLRLPTEYDRRFARDASDVTLTVMTSFPTLVDAILVAAWAHHAPDVAIQMTFINAEVIAITLALQTTMNVVLSRERPYGRTCGAGGPDDLPTDARYCDGNDRYYSFFSGHTSQSFANAALLCSHHMNMPLYGGGAIEAVPCIAGMVVAGATGLLRILGDMHYATDVITGALIGTATGFLVPWLLHYRNGTGANDSYEHDDEPGDSTPRAPRTQVMVVPNGLGASLVGVF